ncbi:efflux transporter outer membrane subunit [Sphingomonas morindae]|uniref:Efflux transporter outer membrane subunit n=2 Tax=Sphingomonas morindae TaxID=1541170 RepID=A0ABY4XC90_9SPHN|nr:efflux transporter outer membrane subunit [Sphingomonas morindae]USI74566.1 efflux transporter outer membrane subunit [Sphingomonas morindae]
MRSAAAGMLAAIGALLGGCSMAPPYRPPVVATAPVFREAGPWIPAAPALPADGRWWTVFGDPTLDRLESQVAAANPTLAGALGRYQQAQADLREIRSDLLPRLGVSADITQNRQSDNRPLRGSNQPDLYAADTLGGSLAWDLDLWGGLRNRAAAGRAEVQASADDLAAIRLALEAQLATRYVELRGLDAQIALLTDTIEAYRQADALTRRRFAGGIASGIDTARAGALLADARGQRADLAAARALVDHAIASLIGQPASLFSIAPAEGQPAIPAFPTGLPSTLLQRRPDIAAAERRMAAANADIGVAKAAFFPAIGLGGSGGFQNTALAGLISAPTLFWSIGPNIALSIFDGGRRRAQLAVARARWTQATADYRARVLQAFQDVEDDLAQLHHFGEEAQAEADAVRLAGAAEQLALNRYQKGVVTYLDVSTAQAVALQARRKALDLQTRRLDASIRLVRAIGGGWTADAGAPDAAGPAPAPASAPAAAAGDARR